MYNIGLFLLFILSLPKFLWDMLVHKKYRKSIKQRFGIGLPKIYPQNGQKVIWIHAVSVGETKSAAILYNNLYDKHSQDIFVISSITETGHEEAKKSIPNAYHIFLPLDFYPIVKKTVDKISPDIFILVEGDFWRNLLACLRNKKTTLSLISGKISERSYKRFAIFKNLSKEIFSSFDSVGAQNEIYKERFLNLGAKNAYVSGNLKFYPKTPKVRLTRDDFGFQPSDKVVTIGSTHDREEELLLKELIKLPENVKILIVPRHPERFAKVASALESMDIEFSKFTTKELGKRIFLVDVFGYLNDCYAISDLALVGGSFLKNVGGHNILEPIYFKVPVIFGPYMHTQTDMVDLVLSSKTGEQSSIEDILKTVQKNLKNSQEIQAKITLLIDQMKKLDVLK